MVLATKIVSDITFVEVMIAIVIAWIITSVWLRVIDNLSYNTLGLSDKNTLHTFIVALVITVIFIAFTFCVRTSVTDMVIGDTFSTAGGGRTSSSEASNPVPSSSPSEASGGIGSRDPPQMGGNSTPPTSNVRDLLNTFSNGQTNGGVVVNEEFMKRSFSSDNVHDMDNENPAYTSDYNIHRVINIRNGRGSIRSGRF